jgi:hypothetical protein
MEFRVGIGVSKPAVMQEALALKGGLEQAVGDLGEVTPSPCPNR